MEFQLPYDAMRCDAMRQPARALVRAVFVRAARSDLSALFVLATAVSTRTTVVENRQLSVFLIGCKTATKASQCTVPYGRTHEPSKE